MSKRKNLSEFIRNHPNLSIEGLIQEGSKKGLVITKNYIYNIRSKDRLADGEAVRKKVSKKAKVAVVKGQKPRKAQPSVELGTQAVPTSVKALVAQSVAMRPPVAIVFFDSDALVKGMREGFQSDV